jgi:hypothetical protein
MPLPKLSDNDLLWVMTICTSLSEDASLAPEAIEVMLTNIIRTKIIHEERFPNPGADLRKEFYDRGKTTEDFIAFLGSEVSKRRM